MQSCEDIHGYEVRLYSTSPQLSHPNMTNRVGANRTFYMIEEEKLPNSHETYVQVAILYYFCISQDCVLWLWLCITAGSSHSSNRPSGGME